ncbi:glycerophosphodiester phosphodiesterase GDPDL4-like [Cicer arietinum]|uniref:glycerophosphodiester phosphodiesterase n=1 Tax=Cicer arietinum TaxID=3827 RepID=A0A1S2XPF5_CICAR|nr:glycerophosphodiester phosphodiesterase GDPDL4-like [Cicer arietinum]
MCKPRALSATLPLLLLLLNSLFLTLVSAQTNKRSDWNTLTGNPPLVIAHGGFSGIFPDSSGAAYSLALQTSLPDVALWCDVQLTKDAAGICLPNVNLLNSTYVSIAIPNKTTSYSVNGVSTRGYFSVDYTLEDLSNVFLSQGVFSRSALLDANGYLILTVDDVVKSVAPQKPNLWLNIQHDAFYTQHKLSMRSYVLSVSRRVPVSYISSPEVGFLRSITTRFDPKITKLVFRFLNQDDTDPSTNQTYGSLLKNLTFIKTFASGILVPKEYIWPVDASLYLQQHTTLVSDAHKAGLEVYASDFSNDVVNSYNYSYDPLAEYLQFIDNGDFSVDGVLTDFPITPSEAIGCFAHLGANATRKDKTLIISKYGASGDYPACTDLAYKNAILDGADVLDCPVQISKDGIPFCLSSIDLFESTNVAQSSFSGYAMTIPEIKSSSGIFTFNLTWADIKGLTPSIINPYTKYTLFRNPKYKKAGTFVTLSDFLSLTKNHTSLSGVLIIVENAAYLAENQGFSVTDKVIDALRKAGYDKPGSQKVYIQSTNSSVLLKFKEKTNYELVYKIDETVSDAANAAVEDIKTFAGSVVINKDSVFPQNSGFITGATNTVPKLQASNLSVFVETFSNEFVSQAWDFFSDSTVEINSYIQGAGIDGVITDFPKTASRYSRNKCLNLGKNTPPYMEAVETGGLYSIISPQSLPPALAPIPPLTKSEVVEPPLPSVVAESAPASSPAAGTKSPPGNAQPKVTVCFFLSSMAVFVASLLLL